MQRLVDEKYAGYRSARSDMPDDARAVYEVAMKLIEITPDRRVLNWDNARLGLD